jgi:DNA processing protein
MSQDRPCDRCLMRTWLLARLAGHLEPVRGRIAPVLALDDEELIAAVGGLHQRAVRDERSLFDPDRARGQAESAQLELICRCAAEYPAQLRDLESPPAILHVAGGLDRFLACVADEPVAIVGARRASPYGLEVARSLGRGLGVAGVTVLSGMALGIDSAAHAGALAAGAPTVAVLPGDADRPYPPGKRALHRQIRESGAEVSELPPGAGVWRWMFPARNRIIAALARMTVVVEAGGSSGALVTARIARELGRPVGAVPGRVTSPQAAGSNGLLADGARIVRDPQDVLDEVFGAGVRKAARDTRPALTAELQALLAALADGHDTPAALAGAGFPAAQALTALASLELAGYVSRGPSGRFSLVP